MLTRLSEYVTERKSPKDKETGLPKKYVSGLSDAEKKKRKNEFEEKANKTGDARYEMPETSKGKVTKESEYTKKFREQFGTPEDLENPSNDPLKNIVELVHNKLKLDKRKIKNAVEKLKDRGAEAWVTGHRPGANQQQWYLARIYSFFTKGKTYQTADKDIAKELGF
jgi:hypothetical protein